MTEGKSHHVGTPANELLQAHVVTRLAGQTNGPAIMLMAHYDSVGGGPGAADDTSSVAELLQMRTPFDSPSMTCYTGTVEPSSRNMKVVDATVSALANETAYSTHPAQVGLAPAPDGAVERGSAKAKRKLV